MLNALAMGLGVGLAEGEGCSDNGGAACEGGHRIIVLDRFDKPEGSSDVFGCGALLAEMIFGISERCPVTGGNWTHLLFTMSDPEAKVELLTTFRDSQDPQVRQSMMRIL